MKKLLFLCSQNKLRSPTAEAVFSEYEGFETDSAGLDRYAQVPVSSEQIYDVLKPGGIFVNADQVLGKTSDLEELYRQHWLDSVRDKGISEEDLKAAQKRMEYDRMATLDIQLHWLETAGFQNVDCWYKNFSFAVFGGYRPTI